MIATAGTRLGVWIVLAAMAAAASAHDLWVEPSAFASEPGEPVAIHLRIGERFEGEAVPRDEAGTSRLAVLAPGGERELPGVDGVAPAGFLEPLRPGAHWVVYESRPRRLTLESSRFEAYLREEGLDAAIALRAARGETAVAGREVYRRCAKSLLVVGGSAAGLGRPAGCEMELLLDRLPDPSGGAGDEVVLTLTLRGAPAAGVLVSALAAGRPEPADTARTDSRGRVSFPVGAPGVWLFRAVQMEPIATPEEGADWRSWWASLTVRLGDR